MQSTPPTSTDNARIPSTNLSIPEISLLQRFLESLIQGRRILGDHSPVCCGSAQSSAGSEEDTSHAHPRNAAPNPKAAVG